MAGDDDRSNVSEGGFLKVVGLPRYAASCKLLMPRPIEPDGYTTARLQSL